MLTHLINKTSAKRLTVHPPMVINALMMALIVMLLARLTMQLFGITKDDALGIDALLNVQNDLTHTDLPLQQKNELQIASLHLFGTPAIDNNVESLSTEPAPPVNAPESPLNLTLKGIAADTIKRKSRAIILNNNTGKEEFFAISDNVFKLATLEDIYEDRVLLKREGILETVFLQKESLEDLVQATQSDDQYKTAITEFINNLITQHDPSMTNAIALDNAYRKGKKIGYTLAVRRHDPNGVIPGIGLEDGDLITLITASNGATFTEMRNGDLSATDPGKVITTELEIQRGNELLILFLENSNAQGTSYKNTQHASESAYPEGQSYGYDAEFAYEADVPENSDYD